jgi:CBS domain-containing protein
MSEVPVRDVMTPHVRRMNELTAIVADATLEDAIRLMRQNSLSRVLVVNDEMQLAGVVQVEDLGVERLVSGRA